MQAIETFVSQLPALRDAAAGARELLLADVVMIGEIPSPTFSEGERVRFIVDRFLEGGVEHGQIDEKGNGFGLLRGSRGHQNILLVSNADTLETARADQTIEVDTERMVGPFVGDNSIALAALTTLPLVLERLGIQLKSNLMLLASTRALGRGNLEGLRFFIDQVGIPLHAGICLESVQLGRFNYSCIGLLRGEIQCRLPPDYDWAHYGSSGTIIPMCEVVNRISRIPLPRQPRTNIIVGSIHGGISHNNIARDTTLSFEARSESAEILGQLLEQIEDITEDVGAHAGVQIGLDILTKRAPGGLDIGHPLVRKGRAVLTALGLQPMLYATVSQLAALHDGGIPGLTLGLTTGERQNDLAEIEESVALAPLVTGLVQLAGILLAIDEGVST